MPIRLAISVEGPTEENFVKQVLEPHLLETNTNLCQVTPIIIGTGKRKNKGGSVSIKNIKIHLNNLIHSYDKVSTLYDFYEFKKKGDKNKVELEKDILNSVPDNIKFKVIPYVQMYEFEGLLFSCPKSIAKVLKDPKMETWASDEVNKTNDKNPEKINDSYDTTPKHRLEKEYPKYKEKADGPAIAKEIGILKIKEKCPNFKKWVETLENLK